MERSYFIYILTNRSRTLYIGVTNNLLRRMEEHQSGIVGWFTKKYHLKQLVYFEQTPDVLSAIAREKQIKGWLRRKKIALIESVNPTWKDLTQELTGGDSLLRAE